MKKSSVLSRNFFRRPAVRDLVPDLKLLLAVLSVGCESHVGCWVPVGLGEDAGLDPSVLDGGLADLERRGHVSRDRDTGEIFLNAFFRDNSFKGPLRGHQARTDFLAIQSDGLRRMVLAAVARSPECQLSAFYLQNEDDSKKQVKNEEYANNHEVIAKAKVKAKVKVKTPSPLPPELKQRVDATIRARAAAGDPVVKPGGWAKWIQGLEDRDRAEALAPGDQLLEAERERLVADRRLEDARLAPPPPAAPAAVPGALGELLKKAEGSMKSRGLH